MTTLVTAFIRIYEEGIANIKTDPFRIQQFEYLASTGLPICLFVDPAFLPSLQPLLAIHTNVCILKTLTLSETRTYAHYVHYQQALPSVRNQAKDTFGFLTLMNAKAEFVGEAARINPFNTNQFAWIDFNVFHMFQNKPLQIERLRRLAEGRLLDDRIVMPSCWSAGVHADALWDRINWRFCGAFYMGTRNAVIDFDDRLAALQTIANADKKGITWEVNVWAYLENTTDWRPHCYASNHNDSLISVPATFLSNWAELRARDSLLNDTATCLGLHPTAATSPESWTNILPQGDFEPTSLSYCVWNDRPLLNIRCVNYRLNPQGAYIINHPDGHLVTRNILFALDPSTFELQGEGIEMRNRISMVSHCRAIQGLEDIRLYSVGDRLRFIATQREYVANQVNRMMIGDVDLDTHAYINGQILEPPTYTSCEKNWIPLVKDGKVDFVYSWSPYRVGAVNESGVLQIHTTRPMPSFFERIRGSTIPIEHNGALWCVVHYSQETAPRTYFHVLVQLDRESYLPLRHSQPFVFRRLGIEFCIGFTLESSDRLRFWFSQHDKDPAWISVSTDAFKWSTIV